MTPPTFLVVGATGNTGKGVVELLPALLQSSSAFRGHRILALTRSKDSAVAKHFASLPNVEIAEQNWTSITAEWLRKENVVRAFVASHNEPSQLADGGTFYREALEAGVTYVVRISTVGAVVRPDSRAYYPRTHWAIENLLSGPEYAALQWTSLQPNAFLPMMVAGVAAYIKTYRETGTHSAFTTMLPESVPVGLIDPIEVGAFAAHLLANEDTAPHNAKRYVLNGPEDVTGAQFVQLIEDHVGSRPQDVKFSDTSMIDFLASQAPASAASVASIKYALQAMSQGLCKGDTTSKEVLEIASPKRTAAMILEDMLRA